MSVRVWRCAQACDLGRRKGNEFILVRVQDPVADGLVTPVIISDQSAGIDQELADLAVLRSLRSIATSPATWLLVPITSLGAPRSSSKILKLTCDSSWVIW